MIEGHLDGVSGFDIAGWAWRPDNPTAPATVELVAAGRVLARAIADRFRADLETAGKREGRCAFRFAIGRLGLKGGAPIRLRADGVFIGQPLVIDAHTIAAAELYASRLAPDTNAASDPGSWSPGPATSLPVRLTAPGGAEGWIEKFDETGVAGWYHDPAHAGPPPALIVVHDKHEIGRIPIDAWRADLAELHNGDGRVGFDAPPPPLLLDGHPRGLDIQTADGAPLLDHPIRVQLPSTTLWPPRDLTSQKRPRRSRGVELSFIVLFYNMRREAERTLTSLSRAFQRDIDDVDYEVICIDNGSKEPLDPDWVASFGPEFRLVRPSRLLPSPCLAMNEAAKQAKGRRLALMIDGAHIVTPGVIREALDAFAETPRSVVGLRQWFIGGDQRWLSTIGYTRELEDIAFARIHWPRDGYRLFDVSAPMMPSPNPWFGAVSESNCLMLPADLFNEIGGYDERFDIPGGGVANLDLFSRAVKAVGNVATMLIGEASFHQFHGGTTTNIDEDAKDNEVRRYMHDFRVSHGERLEHLDASRIRLRGSMPTPEASATRQRPMIRHFVGLTDRVRPSDAHLHFDDFARDYLNGYIVEAGVPEETRWLGKPTGVAPGDLINIQEILLGVRPSYIIAVNAREGLNLFLNSMLGALDLGDTRLMLLDKTSPETLAAARAAVGAAEDVLVLLRPDEDDHLPLDALKSWMQLVSYQSYLVFLETARGQPWLGYSSNWRRKAVQLLTGPGSDFEVDPSFERCLVTACPWGYLRRTRAPAVAGKYDPALDDLSAF